MEERQQPAVPLMCRHLGASLYLSGSFLTSFPSKLCSLPSQRSKELGLLHLLSQQLLKHFPLYDCCWDSSSVCFKGSVPGGTTHKIRLYLGHPWRCLNINLRKPLSYDSDNHFSLGKPSNRSLGYFVRKKTFPNICSVCLFSTLCVYSTTQAGKHIDYLALAKTCKVFQLLLS